MEGARFVVGCAPWTVSWCWSSSRRLAKGNPHERAENLRVWTDFYLRRLGRWQHSSHSPRSPHLLPPRGNALHPLPPLPRQPADCPEWLLCRAQMRQTHTTMYFKTVAIMSRNTSFVLVFSLPLKTLLRLILWQKREYLVHGSFQIQKRKKRKT